LVFGEFASPKLSLTTFTGEDARMREQIGYCWQKAAEYAARAQEAPDKETRELFIRFRNSWLSAAQRYQSSCAPVAGTSAQLRPSSLTPEPGTSAWHTRPSDGLTSLPAERLDAA
jgi:hypothetical protein